MVVRTLYSVVFLLLMAGCASAPLATEGVDGEITLAAVKDDREATVGRTVLWGGVIADARNLPERTRLEIVAYPISERTQRPDCGLVGALPGLTVIWRRRSTAPVGVSPYADVSRARRRAGSTRPNTRSRW